MKYRVEYGVTHVATVMETDWIHYAVIMRDYVKHQTGKISVRIIDTATGEIIGDHND
jgi:hypothetical protein